MTTPNYTYKATVLSIHDGDTVSFSVPLMKVPSNWGARSLGFHLYVEDVPWLGGRQVCLHAPMRFLGLNADELATAGGKAALAYLKTLVAVGDVLTIRSSVATHEIDPDKYGDRWDAVLITADGTNVNESMVTSGHAAPWAGQGTKPTT